MIMKEIDNLIAQAEAALEEKGQGVNIVGNLPHYPMVILFNDSFDTNAVHTVFSKMARVWPQSSDRLVKNIYSLRCGAVEYTDCDGGGKINEAEFLRSVADELEMTDAFITMQSLMLYNVIDTSRLDGVDAFGKHYEMMKGLKALVDCPCKTMLIVLLNDTMERRRVSGDIKKYLAKAEGIYDSTVIISTRKRSNSMCKVADLYKIVSDILVISNGDGANGTYDLEYKTRVGNLYNGGTYVLSYIHHEKPVHNIAAQLLETVIDRANELAGKKDGLSGPELTKRLGMSDGRFKLCDRFVSEQNIKTDTAMLSHLPLRRIPEDDFINFKYSNFRNISYDEIIAGLAENYCKNRLSGTVDISGLCESFKKEICEKISAPEFASLTDEDLDYVFSSLNPGTNDSEITVSEYFRRQVGIHMKKDVIFPALRKIIVELRENSRRVVADVAELHSEYKKYIPVDANLGRIYKMTAENYLNSNNISDAKIVGAGNDRSGTVNAIYSCFEGILKENAELFSLPFIEEWAHRLDMSGDRIYKEISNTLSATGNDESLYYYGNYPISEKLKIFMLHTTDYGGKNPTDLYRYLQQTFSDDNLVQYFNTGYDNSIEAVTLISCSGNNLLL